MHELSLAGGVLAIVEQAQAREKFARVRQLTLSVPALSGVEVAALRFALQAISPGSVLQGCDVTIVEPPAQAWCLSCQRAVTIVHRLQDCPACGSARVQVTDDQAMKVVDLRVDDAAPPADEPPATPAADRPAPTP